MTWPGLEIWTPYEGLVAWLPRDHYDPGDLKAGRPTVVVKVLRAERACIVVPRTSEIAAVRSGDVVHGPETAIGCGRPGWWQPRRARRVLFSAYDDEDSIVYKDEKLDDETLARVRRAYEELQ